MSLACTSGRAEHYEDLKLIEMLEGLEAGTQTGDSTEAAGTRTTHVASNMQSEREAGQPPQYGPIQVPPHVAAADHALDHTLAVGRRDDEQRAMDMERADAAMRDLIATYHVDESAGDARDA
jgi:hypothetical protein